MLRKPVGLAVAVALSLPVAATAQAPNVHWESLLPPAPSTTAVQPGPQPGCEVATLACVEDVVAQLRALRAGFGCDHRGVFATAYLTLTEHLLTAMQNGDPAFDDVANLIWQDVRFAAYYYDALDGVNVPGAWRIAFETAAAGDSSGGQDALLGISAHIQRDLPYVLADLGLRKPDGSSRKPDYDRVNDVLNRAFQDVIDEVGGTYDFSFSYLAPSQTFADDFAYLEMVRGWREGAWRNAERLLAAKTPAARARVAATIEANAETWATVFAFGRVGPPGWRAQRDAYCAANFTP